MLEIDVSGLATAGGGKIEIDKLPDGVEFAALPEDHERLGTLVDAEDKFTAHNAASWQSGLLVRVPKGVELDDPLYVRVVGDGTGATFWRLLVVAEEGSRFSLIEEYTSPSGEARGLHEQRGRAVRRTGRKARVRVAAEPLPGDLELRDTSRHRRRDAELDWVAGGFGSRRGKVRIHNDLAGQGATSRVTGRVLRGWHAASRLRHLPAAPRALDDFRLRLQGRSARGGERRVAGDDPRRGGCSEDQRVPGEPQPHPLADAHADSIPGLEILANDVRCTHGATISQVDREQLFYAMSRGLTRGDAERLIVRGFFQDVLDRIELAPVREALADALEARIPRS